MYELQSQAADLALALNHDFVTRDAVKSWADTWLAQPDLAPNEISALVDISVPESNRAEAVIRPLNDIARERDGDPEVLLALARRQLRIDGRPGERIARDLYYLYGVVEGLPEELETLWDDFGLFGYLPSVTDPNLTLERILSAEDGKFDWLP